MRFLYCHFYIIKFRTIVSHFMVLLLLLSVLKLNAQETLSELLKQYNTETIPYISVEALNQIKSSVIILDTREATEYKVSHLKDAKHVGHDFFSIDSIQQKLPHKASTIVVYCSLGIRSETIAHHLKKAGYTNVKNLYGGIFEWKNNDLPIYNMNNKETDSIHAFSEAWSKWLKKGIQVYE